MSNPDLRENEIIKDIQEWEGLYGITSHGRCWNYQKSKWLTTMINTPTVILKRPQGWKTLTIVKLVANHFIPNPNNYIHVRHIDDNCRNNRVDNIEWIKYRMGHIGNYSTISHITKAVSAYTTISA